jgi:hypothetical protein
MAFCFGATVSAVWAVTHPRLSSGRARGLTGHPVAFGWISAVAAIIAVGLVLSHERGARPIGILTLAATAVGISVSGTRSSTFIIVVGFIVLQFGLRSVRRSALFALVATLAVSLALLGVGGETRTRLTGGHSAELSNYGRARLRDEAIVIIHHHGITGIGLRYLFPPHNLILGILEAAGVTGLGGLVLVVVALFQKLATTRDPPALGVISAALGIYTCSWVVNPGWNHWVWLPLALVFGTAHSGEPPEAVGRAQHERALVPAGPASRLPA